MTLGWAFLLICGWLAATVSGAAGFGGALLLMPVLVATTGAKAAVPVLTVAQLLGNLSRAGFGWREVRWRPALAFATGAVPAAVAGVAVFTTLPPVGVRRAVGLVLLLVVALRHTPTGRRPVPERLLPAAGAVVGALSAVAGSAGPLGAVVFLALRLPPRSYVATEAVTAVLIHLSKTLAYGRLAALAPADLARGLALGGAMVLGSWTGRALIGRVPERPFGTLVEILLVASAVPLIVATA